MHGGHTVTSPLGLWSVPSPVSVSCPPVLYFHGFLCSTCAFAFDSDLSTGMARMKTGQALLSPGGTVTKAWFTLLQWRFLQANLELVCVLIDLVVCCCLRVCFSCSPGHKGSLSFFFPERLSVPAPAQSDGCVVYDTGDCLAFLCG